MTSCLFIVFIFFYLVINQNTTGKMKGRLKLFDTTKGFGFIKTQDGNDLFVHYKDITKNSDVPMLESDAEVEFEIKEGVRGPQAANVKIVKD